MKKLLLLAITALAFAGGRAVTVDPTLYKEYDGIKVQNLWLLDRVHCPKDFAADADLSSNNYARRAILRNGIAYVALSNAGNVVVAPGDTVKEVGRILRYDARTGKKLESLELTLNGRPYGGLLCANNIGVDNYGHFWIMPFTQSARYVPFYQLNENTGELKLLAELDKGAKIARTDYCDVIGDITLKEDVCNIISPGASSNLVYGWHNDKGGDSDTWSGFFFGEPSLAILHCYPEAEEVNFSYAPAAKFILGEDDDTRYAGDLFYIDGFGLWPTIYDFEGNIVEDFGVAKADIEANPKLAGDPGANGITEFWLEDHHFIAYPQGQYEKGYKCEMNIVELGEGDSFAGMDLKWYFPQTGLGSTSDTGIRLHEVSVEEVTEGGQPAIMMLDYKCFNGMGVYLLGKGVTPTGSDEPIEPEIPGDLNGDEQVNAGDVSELYTLILAGNFDEKADLNNDNQVNAGDVSELYGIILGGGK